MTYLLDKQLTNQELPGKQAKFASRTLSKLRDVIHKDKSINYFLEKNESLNKVLDIFIRVNSGGTDVELF